MSFSTFPFICTRSLYFLPYTSAHLIQAGTLSRVGWLGEGLPGGVHSSAAGKTVHGRRAKAATKASGSMWDISGQSEVSAGFMNQTSALLPAEPLTLLKEAQETPGTTLIFFSLKDNLFFLRHWLRSKCQN